MNLKTFLVLHTEFLSLLKYKISDETIESIENYLNQPNQDELNEIHLGLALSNFLENKKNYEKSFFYLKI